jgi:hypothetical protein
MTSAIGSRPYSPECVECEFSEVQRRCVGRGGASSRPFLRFTRSLRHSTVTRSAAVRKCISSPDRAGVSFEVSRPLYCSWPRCLRSILFLPFGAAFALCPLCAAREFGWCDHAYPRWGGHTTESTLATSPTCLSHRLLSNRVGVPTTPLCRALALSFAPVLTPLAVSSVALGKDKPVAPH